MCVMWCWQVAARAQQKTQSRSRVGGGDVSVSRKQDVSTAGSVIVDTDVDGVAEQLQSCVVNGYSQSRPSRLELEHHANVNGQTLSQSQNGLPASSSIADDAAVCKLTSSECSTGTVNTQTTSSSNITSSAGCDNASKVSKTTATSAPRPQCGGENSVTETNGNPQSSSLSETTVTSGVQLPSPPPTPPTAKSRLCDDHQVVLPSPARGHKTQCQDGRKNSTPDSVELPPPPSPPLQFCQSSSLDSPGGVLPPPPLDDTLYTIPPRVSPPPPMSPASSAVANLITSATAGKTVTTCSSEMSTFVVDPAMSLVDGLSALSDMMSGFDGETQGGGETESNDQALVRDTRSDLLAAIREGTSYQPQSLCLLLLQLLTPHDLGGT